MGQHKVQHRVPSDDKQEARRVRDLRNENQVLRKKVARLQKFLDKALASGPSLEASYEDTQIPHVGCPECQGQVNSIVLPSGIKFQACRMCGWRKKG